MFDAIHEFSRKSFARRPDVAGVAVVVLDVVVVVVVSREWLERPGVLLHGHRHGGILVLEGIVKNGGGICPHS